VNSGAPTTGAMASPPASTGGAPALPPDAGVAKACESPLGGGYGYPLRAGVSNGDVPQANGSGGTSGASPSTGDKGGGNTNAPAATNPGSASSSGGCSLAGGGAKPTALLLLALVALCRVRRRSR
jgi:MYXO-CTERM domain-containing protein